MLTSSQCASGAHLRGGGSAGLLLHLGAVGQHLALTCWKITGARGKLTRSIPWIISNHLKWTTWDKGKKGRKKKAKDPTPSERKHISDIDPNWEEEGLLLRHRD